MDTQWSAWRRQLAAAGKGGGEYKPIRRDTPYSLVLAFAADYSADAFSASLRAAPDAEGASIADFAVTVGAYTGGYTNVTLALTKTQIGTLPPDGDGDGLAEVAFDLLHTPSGGSQQLLMGGTIPILGRVTAGA